jgi:hypothetical protein
MKLYELPRHQNTKIYGDDGEYYGFFHNIDGMYSCCTTPKDEVFHLFAGTPVEPYKDGYRIVNELDK